MMTPTGARLAYANLSENILKVAILFAAAAVLFYQRPVTYCKLSLSLQTTGLISEGSEKRLRDDLVITMRKLPGTTIA